jgi:methyltransferase (TIGR00027 family)
MLLYYSKTPMSTDSNVTHIADTALWVATYRAIETESPNPAFRDPLARKLTGERGQKIAEAIAYMKVMAWYMVMRTVAIDEMVQSAISLGADTVVNLGAGLDTRPYRMELPSSLRWIEVDFPHMIQYKKEKLKNESPVCKLESIEADLSDVAARRALFERIGSESKKALVITEGVVIYLTSADAEVLSRDILAVPSFKYWIQDYRQGGIKRDGGRMKRALKETPFRFEAEDCLGFFQGHGWRILEKRLTADQADRMKRPFPFIFPWTIVGYFMPKKAKLRFRNSSGFVMYEKP